MKKMPHQSKSDKRYLKNKFHKLKQEGYRGKQLVAVALSYARKTGHAHKARS